MARGGYRFSRNRSARAKTPEEIEERKRAAAERMRDLLPDDNVIRDRVLASLRELDGQDFSRPMDALIEDAEDEE